VFSWIKREIFLYVLSGGVGGGKRGDPSSLALLGMTHPVMPSVARHLLLYVFGGVLRGILLTPSMNWRPLANSARSDTFWKGVSPLSNFPPKVLKSSLGGVRGGSVHLLDLKEETPHCVRGDTPPGHAERSEASPPLCFWGSLEGVMSNPLN
jgi:hypothetical protein